MEQTNALSKAESNALTVSYDVMGTHVELDLPFVKQYLVRGRADYTSDQEVVFFMNTCKALHLNPLVYGDVYLIKYSKDDPAQIVLGKDRYLRRATDHPDYLCKEDGIIVRRGNEIVKKEGCCPYPGEELIGGWCRVYFVRRDKERTTYKEVAFSEYNNSMSNWKSKPATMINKVAISQCVRDAFPKDFEGIYSEEEMVASGAIPVDRNGNIVDEATPENDELLENSDETITQEQRQNLFRTAQSVFGKENGNALIRKLITEAGYNTTQNMPLSVFYKVYDELMEAIDDARAAEAQRDCENPRESETE